MNYSSQSMNRVVEPRSHVQWYRSMRFRKSFRAAGNIANLLILTVVFFLIFPHGMPAQASEDVPSTAWKDGRFHVDVAGVVRRSDIVLARPNMEAGEAMPLGNGRLGVAVWSADGLTAQLNRRFSHYPVLQAIKTHAGVGTEVVCANGLPSPTSTDTSKFAEAEAAARRADVAIVVVGDESRPGEHESTSGENQDGATLDFPRSTARVDPGSRVYRNTGRACDR